MNAPLRLALLGSTNGTNMLHLIEAIEQKQMNARIELVLSNKSDAMILSRAKAHQLRAEFVDSRDSSREEYDQILSDKLQLVQIDLIVLIGYMKILSPSFVNQWRHKIINVHPSLLPLFSGLMDRKVHQAVLDAGVSESGCTVHFVTEEVDSGPVLIQKRCSVLLNDTVDTLKSRVQSLEGLALVEAIQKISFNLNSAVGSQRAR